MNQPEREPNRDPQEGSESGGLFSDDYEIKRENPYLRKNRHKAEPEGSTKPPRRSKPATGDAPTDATEADAPHRRRRTFSDFIFEHIKLIAAVLTALVVVSLVIITDVTGWIEQLQAYQIQQDKKDLTMAHVRALVEKEDPIIWSDLTDYARYNTSTAENSVTWYFEVKGTTYELWISGMDTTMSPKYVYLYDLSTGDRMDLNRDNQLDRFLDPDRRLPSDNG